LPVLKPLMYTLCEKTLECLMKVFYHLGILDKSNVGLTEIKMENEYVDDWSCKECGHTGISEAEDACPECDSTWAEQND